MATLKAVGCICLSVLLYDCCYAQDSDSWRAHEVMRLGHCNTAATIDVNEDGLRDVIASSSGRVSLFIAPDWNEEIVLQSFSKPSQSCIHSTTIDADGDGDLDWVGALAHDHPFWLENPGPKHFSRSAWKASPIDNEITGIHCILKTDVDRDGHDDLVI
ncbi:MAG: VCBS repeat-containing protein, partial [Planctomycetota bacterium]